MYVYIMYVKIKKKKKKIIIIMHIQLQNILAINLSSYLKSSSSQLPSGFMGLNKFKIPILANKQPTS